MTADSTISFCCTAQQAAYAKGQTVACGCPAVGAGSDPSTTPAENVQDASATSDPDTGTDSGRTERSVDLSPVRGVVQAILDVTPTRFDGVCANNDCALANNDANAHEIAAKQAAVAIRAVAEWVRERQRDATCRCPKCIDELADEVEANAEQGQD